MNGELPELWQRVRDGEVEAWEAVVDQFATLVYSVARRNGLNPADAEDCCQQTWMALYASRFRIRDGAKLPGWLAGTAYRRAMRILRKQASRKRTEEQIPDSEPPLLPDQQLVLIRRRRILQQAMGELDERCRALLTALFLVEDEISYRELSKNLKIPFNSLGPIRKRCLEKLRAILKKDE